MLVGVDALHLLYSILFGEYIKFDNKDKLFLSINYSVYIFFFAKYENDFSKVGFFEKCFKYYILYSNI